MSWPSPEGRPPADGTPSEGPQDAVYPTPYPSSYPSAPEVSYDPPHSTSYGVPGQPMPAYSRATDPGDLPRDHGLAIAAFIIGIFSVAGFAIGGPVAIVLANKAIREIDRNPDAYTNRGLALAGRVLGIIGTVFLGLAIVVVVGLVVAVKHSTSGAS